MSSFRGYPTAVRSEIVSSYNAAGGGSMSISWQGERGGLMWSTGSVQGVRFRLVVEQLPAGGWDWTVWRDGEFQPRYGLAETASAATSRAEAVIREEA
jgi:hypothetical protein